jgi:3-oxoacyl-[acyl-carrier protein] reductase
VIVDKSTITGEARRERPPIGSPGHPLTRSPPLDGHACDTLRGMDLGLEGRVYIVTGGSRGLGRAAAAALVADGARVVLCSRDPAELEAAAAALGGSAAALPIPGDLVEDGLAERLVASAHARFGRLDGVLVSVGGPPHGSALEVTDEQWVDSFRTVFLGSLRLVTAVARSAGVEGASVVLVLSTSVTEPLPGLAVSNGLRPGLAMVAKSLADELGQAGIRVNAVLPGRIDTDRSRELDDATGDPDGTRRSLEERIPLRRYGQPEEFGKVAAFLLSPAASYVTGTSVAVDGGFSRRP